MYQKTLKFYIQHRINKHPEFRWVTINTCFFATLKMSYSFNRIYEGRRFVKLQIEWQITNSMDGSVLHIEISTVEAQTVCMSASQEGRTMKEDFLPISTTQESTKWMSLLTHCLQTLEETVIDSNIRTFLGPQCQELPPINQYFSEFAQ